MNKQNPAVHLLKAVGFALLAIGGVLAAAALFLIPSTILALVVWGAWTCAVAAGFVAAPPTLFGVLAITLAVMLARIVLK